MRTIANFAVPQRMLDTLDEITAGTRVPVEPRDAASMILLREPAGPGSTEALLMLRQRSMSFAAGVVAFAGGSVDPSDSAVALRLAETELAGWARALRIDPGQVGAVLSAAIRETFEETGVLLATRDGEPIDASTPEWRERRRAVEAHELAWDALVRDEGIALQTGRLRLWSCWITPIVEPKRFRSWFFLVSIPSDQPVEIESTEAFRSAWITPSAAVEAFERGEIQLLPPQQAILGELAMALEDTPLAEVQAAAHNATWVEPVVRRGPDGAYLEIVSTAF
jgi:8-oxo-dGTP pyrophosphatase MutT (NUDIX family)